MSGYCNTCGEIVCNCPLSKDEIADLLRHGMTEAPVVEQEPVGEIYEQQADGSYRAEMVIDLPIGTKLYTNPQTNQCEQHIEMVEQKPIAWKDVTYGNLHHQNFGNSIPLYTHPQPEREPLSDSKLLVLLKNIDSETNRLPTGFKLFARAIEKAHGIGD
jgi:hypothetical protein